MQLPGLSFLRRKLFSRLVTNLATALGVFQALIAHWLWTVALAQPEWRDPALGRGGARARDRERSDRAQAPPRQRWDGLRVSTSRPASRR
jgi:hypothetical protein